MRPVDADDILLRLDKRMTYEAGRTHAYLKGIRDAMKEIDAARTVDAIPVEWLRKYTVVGIAPNGRRLTEGKERLVINRILNEWQKEQGAR